MYDRTVKPQVTTDGSASITELLERLGLLATRTVTLMEVCGTHTMAVCRFGLRELLPPAVKLLSGPGCPVCVTPRGYVDQAVLLAEQGVRVATFGDLIRVPGSRGSLHDARARGADIVVVYSPLDAVELARQTPECQTVFLAVGFETTAPVIAVALQRAIQGRVQNFSLLPGMKTVFPALHQLAQGTEIRLDGLLLPGHVTAVTGLDPYRFLAQEYRIPGVVAGFEAGSIMRALVDLVGMVVTGEARIENAYRQVVSDSGNLVAQRLISDTFRLEGAEWRGLGRLEESGWVPRDSTWDARIRFGIPELTVEEPLGCCCGAILRGAMQPLDCPLFGMVCTPTEPVGACMVSSEGTCAAYYRYRGIEDTNE